MRLGVDSRTSPILVRAFVHVFPPSVLVTWNCVPSPCSQRPMRRMRPFPSETIEDSVTHSLTGRLDSIVRCSHVRPSSVLTRIPQELPLVLVVVSGEPRETRPSPVTKTGQEPEPETDRAKRGDLREREAVCRAVKPMAATVLDALLTHPRKHRAR